MVGSRFRVLLVVPVCWTLGFHCSATSVRTDAVSVDRSCSGPPATEPSSSSSLSSSLRFGSSDDVRRMYPPVKRLTCGRGFFQQSEYLSCPHQEDAHRREAHARRGAAQRFFLFGGALYTPIHKCEAGRTWTACKLVSHVMFRHVSSSRYSYSWRTLSQS